jgi:hypothetical protein
MKCMSCEAEISPKWKYAIENNICPFCGQPIMDELLKNLLTTLQDVMDNLNQYPAYVEDLMLINYNYIKIDSPNLVSYVPADLLKGAAKQKTFEKVDGKKQVIKVESDGKEQEVVVEQIQSEERTNLFAKRAEAVKPNLDGFNSIAEKTEHLRKMAQKIRKAGMSDYQPITQEMMDGADPEDVAEMQQLISENDIIASALPTQSSDDGDEIPSVVLAMASKANGNGGQKSSAADIAKLQRMYGGLEQSSKNFQSGSKGSFSRS